MKIVSRLLCLLLICSCQITTPVFAQFYTGGENGTGTDWFNSWLGNNVPTDMSNVSIENHHLGDFFSPRRDVDSDFGFTSG